MGHVPRQLSCNTAQECVAALSTSGHRSLASNTVVRPIAALTGTFVTPNNARAHESMLPLHRGGSAAALGRTDSRVFIAVARNGTKVVLVHDQVIRP